MASIRVTREQACFILEHDILKPGIELMCKEYGLDQGIPEGEWVGIYPDEYEYWNSEEYDHEGMPEEYQTFELWT